MAMLMRNRKQTDLSKATVAFKSRLEEGMSFLHELIAQLKHKPYNRMLKRVVCLRKRPQKALQKSPPPLVKTMVDKYAPLLKYNAAYNGVFEVVITAPSESTVQVNVCCLLGKRLSKGKLCRWMLFCA